MTLNQISSNRHQHMHTTEQAGSSSGVSQRHAQSSNNGWVKKYIDSTNAELKSVHKTIGDLALTHKMPFNQGVFEDTLAVINPAVRKLIPKAHGGSGVCLGLTTAWLNDKFSGKSEGQFHKDLLQNSNGILNAVIKTQYEDQASSQEGSNEEIPINSIAEYAAMTSGLKLMSISKNEVSKSIDFEPLAKGISTLESLFKGNLPTQGFMLLSDKHACALFRDRHDNFDFFDPNQGVINSQPANRANLFGYILMTMAETSSNRTNSISVTEVQPNTRQEQKARLLNPFLS